MKIEAFAIDETDYINCISKLSENKILQEKFQVLKLIVLSDRAKAGTTTKNTCFFVIPNHCSIILTIFARN